MPLIRQSSNKRPVLKGSIARHACICLVSVILLVGLPAYFLKIPKHLIAGADAITSPTVVIEKPSGDYIVLINREAHTDTDKLSTWTDFFMGKEIGYLFEDISCAVLTNDIQGVDIARSFASRLPENQMKISSYDDATLLLSKAYYGHFDIILMSSEAYRAYGADRLAGLSFIEYISSSRE